MRVLPLRSAQGLAAAAHVPSQALCPASPGPCAASVSLLLASRPAVPLALPRLLGLRAVCSDGGLWGAPCLFATAVTFSLGWGLPFVARTCALFSLERLSPRARGRLSPTVLASWSCGAPSAPTAAPTHAPCCLPCCLACSQACGQCGRGPTAHLSVPASCTAPASGGPAPTLPALRR